MLLLLLVAVVMVVHASPHHQSAPVGTVASAAAGQVAGDEILIAVVSCVLRCLVCKDRENKKDFVFQVSPSHSRARLRQIVNRISLRPSISLSARR